MNAELVEWNAQERQAGEIERLIELNCKLGIEGLMTEVFQFLLNLESMPKWNYFVFDVNKTSDGPVGINTVFFRQKRKTDGQEYKMAEYELNKMVAFGFQQPSVKLTKRFLPGPSSNDNCSIAVNERKFDTGIPSLVARIDTTNVGAAVDKNIEKAKQMLETGKTILQYRRKERD